jgi:predicted RNA-binding Zn ribbon-like protein
MSDGHDPGHDDVTPVEAMDLVGGDVSLDFVNTASARATGRLKEKLRTYGDLVTWAERVELASPERGVRLRRAAERSPGEADAVLTRARSLREAIYEAFGSGAPPPASLNVLSAEAARAAAERRLAVVDGVVDYVWPESDALEQLLWPVALSAAELLTSEERARVKECAADACNWLFLDRSRNRSRRWCDMKECGNRAKARRFQARQRTSGG